MNIEQCFQKQLDSGVTEMFFYCVETADPDNHNMKSHKGSLASFPDLAFVKMLTDGIPLFKVSL